MTPEMIRQLPAGHALVIRGGHSPVIARLRMGWKDRRYRSARRAGYAIAKLTPIAQHGVTPAWTTETRPDTWPRRRTRSRQRWRATHGMRNSHDSRHRR